MNAQIPGTADQAQAMQLQQKMQLAARARSGTDWFFWIAGLSLINSVAYALGANFAFVIGLGITQVTDYLAREFAAQVGSSGTLVRVIGFIFALVVAGIFAVFGLLGRKGSRVAVVIGMVLYALDAVLLVIAQDWLSVAFHAWGLFGIFTGLRAMGQLEALDRPPGSDVIQTLD